METGRGLTLQIGGMRLHAESISADLQLIAPPPMDQFCCAPEPPAHVSASVDWGQALSTPPGTLIFHSGGIWELFRDGTDLVYLFSSRALGTRPYRWARFDAQLSQGQIEVDRDYARKRLRPGIEPFAYPLDELLLAHRLPRQGGIELHACGIVDEAGQGHLFVGQSGAGKTTAAQVWARHRPGTVLSDDRIVVRLDTPVPRMFGTPWHGEASLSTAADAPIRAIYLLRKHSGPRLLPMGRVAAVAALLACSFIPFHDAEAPGAGHRPGE